MKFIDTHNHIDAEVFSEDRDQLLAEARQAGISRQVMGGISEAGWKNILHLAEQEPDLYATLGIHPQYTDQHSLDVLDRLKALLPHTKICAIGEIGLDFYNGECDSRLQSLFFEMQLDIAQSMNLPVILHVRKAHDQVLSTLRKKKFSNGGIVHAFNGSMQQAETYINMGFVLGFGGTVTHTHATKIRGIATLLPQHAIVLETDAPDLPPMRHNREINLPHYLIEIAEEIAALRGITVEELAGLTTANARRILALG